MSFKGILIDLDDTLYAYDPCHEFGMNSLFKKFIEETQLNMNEVQFQKAYAQSKTLIKENTTNTAASHNRALYIQNLLETLDIWDPKLVLTLYESYWSGFLEKMELFDDVISFFEKYKDIPKYIVTDLTAHIQNRKLIKLDLVKSINGMITSEEAGAEKPTRQVFELSLKKIKLNPKDVIFIGDNLKKDALGAADFGMQGYHLLRSEVSKDCGNYKQIQSLSEI